MIKSISVGLYFPKLIFTDMSWIAETFKTNTAKQKTNAL